MLSPLFFVLYTTDAFLIAEELDFSIHGYADDLQIYDHCFVCDTQQLNNQVIHCIDCMGQWMRRNCLKLNAAKTEFIWLGGTRLSSCHLLLRPDHRQWRSCLAITHGSQSGRHHRSGHQFRRPCSQLRFEDHWPFEFCHALVRAMVLSRLDYCNGLLTWRGPEGPTWPKGLLGQLSGVTRAAARFILVLPRQSHMTS